MDTDRDGSKSLGETSGTSSLVVCRPPPPRPYARGRRNVVGSQGGNIDPDRRRNLSHDGRVPEDLPSPPVRHPWSGCSPRSGRRLGTGTDPTSTGLRGSGTVSEHPHPFPRSQSGPCAVPFPNRELEAVCSSSFLRWSWVRRRPPSRSLKSSVSPLPAGRGRSGVPPPVFRPPRALPSSLRSNFDLGASARAPPARRPDVRRRESAACLRARPRSAGAGWSAQEFRSDRVKGAANDVVDSRLISRRATGKKGASRPPSLALPPPSFPPLLSPPSSSLLLLPPLSTSPPPSLRPPPSTSAPSSLLLVPLRLDDQFRHLGTSTPDSRNAPPRPSVFRPLSSPAGRRGTIPLPPHRSLDWACLREGPWGPRVGIGEGPTRGLRREHLSTPLTLSCRPGVTRDRVSCREGGGVGGTKVVRGLPF